jgi:hypothetical protein
MIDINRLLALVGLSFLLVSCAQKRVVQEVKVFSVEATDTPPQVEISNGLVKAKVWIPDPEKGYYRGTRFDWAGVISSLKYKGHEYFGVWKGTSEPHNEIVGPAESFTANDKVLGYNEAKVGDTFMRIGVGLCEKPNE